MLNKPEFWHINELDHRDMRVVTDVNDINRYTFLYTITELVVIHEQWITDVSDLEISDLEINVHKFNLEDLGYIITDPWGKPRGLYMPKDRIEFDLVLDGKFPPERRITMSKETLYRFVVDQQEEIKLVETSGAFRYFDRDTPNFLDDWGNGDVVAVLTQSGEIHIVEIRE